MGFKQQLRPMQNICVKTDYQQNSPHKSTASDMFHSEDLIKQPKTSPSIYSKTNSSQFYPEQHRHSIVTLLQPPVSGTVRKMVPVPVGRGRRNSENTLTAAPHMKCQNSYSSSLLVRTAKDAAAISGNQAKSGQSGLIIQTDKLLIQTSDGKTPPAMRKSRIPRKIKIPIFKSTTSKTEGHTGQLFGGLGSRFLKDRSKNTKVSTGINSNMRESQEENFPLLGSTNSNFASFHSEQLSPNMSTTPDRTKLLLISTPAITITSEPIPEEESGSNHDLNEILGNFIEATSPCPSRKNSSQSQESIVTEYGIIDTSKCVDFGIYDFLSENNTKSFSRHESEVEVDNSSDTDASYLEATPPHRFSDSDFELLIEPLAITLDTSLFSSSNIKLSTKRIAHRANSQSNLLFTLNSLIDESGREESFPHQQKHVNAKKPLRRNISLPATIFKLRLISIGKTVNSLDNSIASSPTNSIAGKSMTPNPPRRNSALGRARLSRLDSISSTGVEHMEHGSLESLSTASVLWSAKSTRPSCSDSNPSFHSDSAASNSGSFDLNEDNEYVFSEIEKQALNMRHVRNQLRRQDTLGNIAPPDFCNT